MATDQTIRTMYRGWDVVVTNMPYEVQPWRARAYRHSEDALHVRNFDSRDEALEEIKRLIDKIERRGAVGGE